MRAAFVVILVGACSYKPGSFSYPARTFPGQRASVGCLDVSVDRRADMDASAVLQYQFGNRCDRPVTIDLGRVPVVGRTAGGADVRLTPFDPAMEMRALKLDARQAGGEAIAYPASEPLAQVCVDVAAIARDGAEAHWLCFATSAELEARS